MKHVCLQLNFTDRRRVHAALASVPNGVSRTNSENVIAGNAELILNESRTYYKMLVYQP